VAHTPHDEKQQLPLITSSGRYYFVNYLSIMLCNAYSHASLAGRASYTFASQTPAVSLAMQGVSWDGVFRAGAQARYAESSVSSCSPRQGTSPLALAEFRFFSHVSARWFRRM
jgi:hypothetical protein